MPLYLEKKKPIFTLLYDLLEFLRFKTPRNNMAKMFTKTLRFYDHFDQTHDFFGTHKSYEQGYTFS